MTERGYVVCLPTVERPFAPGGGHLNTVRFAELLDRHRPTRLASYKEREAETPFLEDLAPEMEAQGSVMVTVWGPHVTGLVERYRGRFPIVYYKQSIGFGVELPPEVPILTFGRFLMTYAQEHYPGNPLYYMPAILQEDCKDQGLERDVDVLVVARKQPPYILEKLVPALRDRCRLELLETFVPRGDLYTLFNRSKVVLYAFGPQRSNHLRGGWRLMEGFATQVLEALACGCSVFSDARGGHAELLEPGRLGHQLMSHSPEWDVHQILEHLDTFPGPFHEDRMAHAERLREHYGEPAFHRRAKALVDSLDRYFDFISGRSPSLEAFGLPEPESQLTTMSQEARRKLGRVRKEVRTWLKGDESE